MKLHFEMTKNRHWKENHSTTSNVYVETLTKIYIELEEQFPARKDMSTSCCITYDKKSTKKSNLINHRLKSSLQIYALNGNKTNLTDASKCQAWIISIPNIN